MKEQEKKKIDIKKIRENKQEKIDSNKLVKK